MFLTASVQAPHASPASTETDVYINEQTTARGRHVWSRVETTKHRLAVPAEATWTLETVRAMLTTLRRYLPPHDASDAHAIITVSGRQRWATTVTLAVRARGWEAQADFPAQRRFDQSPVASTFTKPMLAALRDLGRRCPLAVARLAPVALDNTTPPDPPVADLADLAGYNDLRTLLAQLPSDRQRRLLKTLRAAVTSLAEEIGDE